MEFVEDIHNLGASGVSSLICGLIGLPAGGWGGVALGTVCGTLASAIVNNIEGSSATAGVYDRQGNYSVPETAVGASSEYDADHDDLSVANTITAAHISPVVL